MKKIVILIIILFFIANFNFAQSHLGPKSTFRERIEKIEQRLDEFNKRLDILEKQIKFTSSSSIEPKSELEETIEGMLARGTIYDIDLAFNQIRIAPDNWHKLDLLQKKTLAKMLSDYMFLKTNNHSLLMLKGNSPKALARYDPLTMSDIKIYE